MKVDVDVVNDVLVEFLETWLHSVLYVANVYPSQVLMSLRVSVARNKFYDSNFVFY